MRKADPGFIKYHTKARAFKKYADNECFVVCSRKKHFTAYLCFVLILHTVSFIN